MTATMSSPVRAHILGTGSFLPNAPVPNEKVEDVLGPIGGKPSRARHRVQKSSGITLRHYAVDPATRRPTHTNAALTVAAIQNIARTRPFALTEVDCLACGTATPDFLVPNHALMVHGELGNPPLEVAATAGTCLSGLTALKYATASVASGMSRLALATASERSSSFLRSVNFPRAEPRLEELERDPLLAFGQDFLRWMLSDGAGAVLVGRHDPARPGLALAIEWIEILSYAHELPTCMHMGGETREDGTWRGWRDAANVEDAVRAGELNLTQDTRLLGREIVETMVGKALGAVRARHRLTPDQIDWYLPHYSSEYFRQPVYDKLRAMDFEIPFERWFTNLPTKGNTGSASIYIMLDELVRSGKLAAGQKLLCFVPESARFSAGYMLLTVVHPG
jgi:3-oxoacyl-[acyl-carrier-protein] synthase-3